MAGRLGAGVVGSSLMNPPPPPPPPPPSPLPPPIRSLFAVALASILMTAFISHNLPFPVDTCLLPPHCAPSSLLMTRSEALMLMMLTIREDGSLMSSTAAAEGEREEAAAASASGVRCTQGAAPRPFPIAASADLRRNRVVANSPSSDRGSTGGFLGAGLAPPLSSRVR